ncbi:DNA repair protein RadC [uncultured Chitinophaga sp.]|uniref:RadC family protein n=1 Tax=uncultured Chitinophaga sp. TaxID=339340 RepID=UPI0025CF2A73|nr:DNA repair protein RadC [uncultured Chitinophaga sp.]
MNVNLKEQRNQGQTAPIKDWAPNDRPREKLLTQGPQVLSDAELLAILLGTGSAQKSAVDTGRELLLQAKNSLHELGKRDVQSLKDVKGIGDAKAVTIAAALELGRRRAGEQGEETRALTCSKDAVKILRPLIGDRHTEHLYVLFLSRSNKLLHHACISHGGTTSAIVDPKVIFGQALLYKAGKIMLGHNHPSGNLTPSQSDLVVTRKIKAAGELLEIDLLDHIILSDEGYYSFMEHGDL